MGLKGKALYNQMLIATSTMFMLYGYDAGVFGGILSSPHFLSAIGNPTDRWTIPLASSSYTLAAFVATIPIMIWGMIPGRRIILIIGCGLVIIGSAVQASAMSVGHLIAGRVICGFGIGCISCTCPPYLAEQAISHETRGPSGMIMGMILIGGIAVAYWIDYGFGKINSQVSWRFPIAFQAFFAIVSLIIFWRLPDTPRWYYASGHIEKGDQTLCLLFDSTLDDPEVANIKSQIFMALELEKQAEESLNIIDFFYDRTELKSAWRLVLAFLIMSLQQMMGINFSVYYSTVIFSNVGLSANLSSLLAAVMNTCFFLGTVPTYFVLEKWGRRNIMMWGAVGLLVSLIIFVACIGRDNPTVAQQWTSVAFIIIYNFLFGFAWIGVPWLYCSEIAPLHLRHSGAAMAAAGEWLFSFVTVFASPIALADPSVTWKIWFWFLLSCAVAAVFVYFLCPEVTNKTLEEIDLIYQKKIKPWKSGSFQISEEDTKKLNRQAEEFKSAYEVSQVENA